MIRYKVILVLFLLVFSFCAHLFSADKPRIVNAIGITGGVTFSQQKYYFSNPDATQSNKFIMGYNGSVRAELFARDYTAIVSELQYNQKGTTEKDTLGNNFKNKNSYLCFNNFYKIYYEMDAIIPYVLIGPRVEYMLSQNTPSPTITGDFKKLHITASAGAGVEFVSYGDIKFFIEAHFNPDVMRSYKQGNLAVRTTAYELRIGLKYVFADKRYACPPVYK